MNQGCYNCLIMTQFNSSYHIGSATGKCHASNRDIEPGQEYIATLCERTQDDAFDRLDFLPDVWESGHRPVHLYSYWRTVMHSPDDDKKNIMVDDNVLINLFQRLEDDDRPYRLAYRFVIGLILIRKRLLKQVGTKPNNNGGKSWLIRYKTDPPETTPFELHDPGLTEDQQLEIADQLREILRGDL